MEFVFIRIALRRALKGCCRAIPAESPSVWGNRSRVEGSMGGRGRNNRIGALERDRERDRERERERKGEREREREREFGLGSALISSSMLAL